MTSALTSEFGYFPEPLASKIGNIEISTLPEIKARTEAVTNHPGVENDWIYPGPQRRNTMGIGIRELPYPSRIFGLPKTHRISHGAADGPEHLEFLVWSLSFFTGMRLTTTEAGFVDATPIKPFKLVDFVLSPATYARSLALAETFWQVNRAAPARAKRWTAALHALFIAHYPQSLQFERFIYLYGALDTCFSLAAELTPPARRPRHHAERIAWMCGLFGMPVPAWATTTLGNSTEVATIRNATIHETLFMNAPLGFALHGVGTGHHLTLEMEALICRLLVALIGAPTADYVRSPVNTRQIHGLDL